MERASKSSEQQNSVYGVRGAGAKTIDGEAITTMSNIDAAIPDTPNERLRNLLDEAAALAHGTDDYLMKCTSPPSEAAKALEAKTFEADWKTLFKNGETMFEFSSRWTTDVVEAKTLAMFAYMLRAQRVVEVGMFTGYGALTIAEALPAHGKMISLEVDPFLEKFSRPVFDSSPHGHKIEVRIGDALATLGAWPQDEKIDMIFIDADKGSYAAYYEAVLSGGLLAPGGVIAVDNTMFKGTPFLGDAAHDDHNWNAGGRAIAAFNTMVAEDDRVEQVMLPVRDGITLIRLKGEPPAPTPLPSAPSVPSSAHVEPPPAITADRESAEASVIAQAQTVAPESAGADADPVIRGVDSKRILDRLRLDGKNALVTGAGQGIGRAFAHALAEAGASVCVSDIALDRAEAVASELREKGARAFAVKADCMKESEVAAMVDAVVTRWGQLHIAVNNAGVNKNSAAEDTPLADWDLTFALNTRGVFCCCQAEARHMLENGYGKIINTASMASLLVPHPQKQAAYNCSKAAVVKMTQSLACEWAARGLNVNAVSPGIVDTPLIWDNPALNKLAGTWLEQIPAGRLAQVTDLQAAIVYLASDASSYMVGHNLVIEGGQSLW